MSGYHGKGDATTIPKFASFKPDIPSEIQRQQQGAFENVNRIPPNRYDSPDKSGSRSEPHRHTLGRHRPREHHDHSLKTEVNRHIASGPAGQDPGSGENIPTSFVIDRMGDPNNLIFGALRGYATASYFRFGAGKVVGLSVSQRIHPALSTDKGLVLSDDTDGLPNKRDKYARWMLDETGVGELTIKLQDGHGRSVDSAADYVSFEIARIAKRRRGHDGLPIDCVSFSAEDDTHLRSAEGRAKSKKEPPDQDLKYHSDTSSSQDLVGGRLLQLDGSAQKTQAQLSRRLTAEPSSFEAWIDLIEHQDNMLGLGQNYKKTSLTNAEKRSNANIKYTMFQKALEQVKDSESREVLSLGMVREASRMWGINKITTCWKNVLQQNPQSLQLWTKYLDFMQTSFTCFTFEEVKMVYLDCLDLINEARTNAVTSLDQPNKAFDIQIYVVLRMTLFMRESGFAEHATAAWQALIEFAFFKPITVQASNHDKGGSSHEAAASMFEIFWESEVPRIGEAGAEGWASFYQKQGEPPQPRTEAADYLEDSKDPWKSWLASEQRHTIDDVKDNDPYRIILFSDIRPFLIDPPSNAGQQLILDAFIVFCHLPPFVAEGPDSLSRVWGRDCFLRNDALRLNGKLQESWKLHFPIPKQYGSSDKQHSIGRDDTGWHLHPSTQDPFQFPVVDYQVSSDSLFAGKRWFSAFDTWQEQCSGGGGPVEVAWVLRSLKMLISAGAGNEAVAVYVLGLELRTSPGTVRKTAKNLLRKRPSSILLYNAYALIEYRLADTKKGESIITMSIDMGKKLDEVSQRDSILLWRTWIWETLTAGSAQEALVRLLTIGNEDFQMSFSQSHLPDDLGSAQPALLLQTERTLVAIRDHMLSLCSYRHASFAIECLILFAYLRNAQTLSTATSAFRLNIALLSTYVSPNSSNHEYLYQSFTRLLYHHTTHTHLFKPSDIRSLLAENIAQFPQNTIFLSLYAWNEARFRINDRVRSVVKELVLGGSAGTKGKPQESVIPHLFAVYSELHRGPTLGSNNSTIRSTFERAVQSDSGAHCAGLWKLYFLFEHSRSEAERAKMVFWRAVRACPWAKDLYMLAFEHLTGENVMGEADLRGVYELLGEKELRMHVVLEDITEGIGEGQLDQRG